MNNQPEPVSVEQLAREIMKPLTPDEKAWIDAAWQKFKSIPPIRHWAEDMCKLCCEIEKLPASEQQTKCSVMASNLSGDISAYQRANAPEKEKK